MGQTALFSLPYPEYVDSADARRDYKNLADAVEAALIAVGVPVGTILDWPYASGNIPAWALLPYGQAISRTTYSVLHTLAAAAGYPHGSGDGSSTFTLPDLRGRVLAGKDDMGGTTAGRITVAISGLNGATLGVVGGTEGVTLVTAQLPAHNHSGTTGNDSPDHTHSGTTGNDAPDHAHSGSTGWQSADHAHYTTTGDPSANHQHMVTMQRSAGYGLTAAGPGYAGNVAIVPGGGGTDVSYWGGTVSAWHTHSGWSGGVNTNHYHDITVGGRSVFHQHPFGSGGASARHAHSIPNDGSGTAFRVVQPVVIVNKMMRVK